MERRPLGEATNIGACVTFKCPDDEFVELAPHTTALLRRSLLLVGLVVVV